MSYNKSSEERLIQLDLSVNLGMDLGSSKVTVQNMRFSKIIDKPHMIIYCRNIPDNFLESSLYGTLCIVYQQILEAVYAEPSAITDTNLIKICAFTSAGVPVCPTISTMKRNAESKREYTFKQVASFSALIGYEFWRDD